MKSVFNQTDVTELLSRIQKLSPASLPAWGKMDVAQMLAHCNVSYEFIYTDLHPKPGGLQKWILQMFVKKVVVNEKPFRRNSRTAPAFIMKSSKDFESEKNRLTGYIKQTLDLGESYFNGKESLSFGKLTGQEWNNMLYKHLDHHLTQFGV